MKSLLFFASIVSSGWTFSQTDVTPSGGDYTSSQGSVSISVGQIVYSTIENNGSVNQGVQQPYEFYLLDISEKELNFGLSIFPNPTNGIITIEVANQYPSSVKLMDAAGKEIIIASSFVQNHTIDLSDFSRGTYFLTITNSDNSKAVKIIKN